MSAQLVIFGGADPDAPMAWRRVARGGGANADSGVLGEGTRPTAATPDTVLVLPGSEAQVRVLEEAGHSDAQARAAASFLFRGALASEAEGVIYAIGQPMAGGRRLVAAFERARIEQWLKQCERFGLSPSAIHLDCALWPVQAGQVDIVGAGGRVIVAGGDLGGFTIERELAPPLFTSWLERLTRKPSVLNMIGDADDAAFASLGALLKPDADADVMSTLAHATLQPSPRAPVLRPRDVSSVRAGPSPTRAWAFAAALAVALILVQAGLALVDGLRDADAAKGTTASAERAFHAARPDVKRIVNLRAQVTSAINAAKVPQANPVLTASGRVSGVLRSHTDVRLEEMRYDAAEKRVLMRLSGPSPAALDAAVTDLRAGAPDLDVGEMESVNARASISVSLGVA